MKKLLFVACAAAVVAVFAAETNASDAEKDKEAKRQLFLSRSGGFVPNKTKTEGCVALINAQKLIPSSSISETASDLEDSLWFRVIAKDSPEVSSLEAVADVAKKSGGNVTVVVAGLDIPVTIMNIPEWKTCVVNVKKLSEGVTPDKLAIRVKKEISRAVCFALQMPYATEKGGLYDALTSLSQLDKVLVDSLGGEQRMGAAMYADMFGIENFKRTTYRKACEMGIASKPRNKYQQAIWDEYHSVPTKPIVIEPEPSKK